MEAAVEGLTGRTAVPGGAANGPCREVGCPMTAEPVVVVDDLHVSYRAALPPPPGAGGRRVVFRRVPAVRGVSLVARRGEAIGVLGANGAGKSSLLRAVAGLHPPDRGRVWAGGRPALLGVDPGLVKDLSGERNIVLGCLAMGMTAAEVRARYDGIAEFADLGDALDRPLGTYSTGMVQRLRFAVTTAAEHDVLLVDEALATGDAAFRRRSARRMAELRARAGAVFLVSHSLPAILESCGRAVWLEDGRLRADGPAEEVVAAYQDGGPERTEAPEARGEAPEARAGAPEARPGERR
jgi:teichoic acid transport system ATP-binding protein